MDANRKLAEIAVEVNKRGRVVDSEEVKELKAENERMKAERRWIPVNKTIPDHVCYVLAYGFREEYNLRAIWTVRYNPEGEWLDDVEFKPVAVTHWMPLPEPPKGNES